MILQRQRVLTGVLHDNQFYYLGTLLFAFTLFYSYIDFAQYFVVWNGNMPEETFWYLIRENGSWWALGMLIIFGHFLAAVPRAAAHVREIQFQNHAAASACGRG